MKLSGHEAADRVLPGTRVLAGFIVPVLVTAFIILYLFPHDTGRLFAWPVQPPMTALMLGATYLGGAYFFTRVVVARQWHTVALGLLPVSVFAGIMGIATLLHWDRFTPGHIAFILWALLYLTLPFVIPVVWYVNRRANQGGNRPASPRLPGPARWVLGGLGAVLAGVSLLLLLFPGALLNAWPWTLSPLTARVMSAMFALAGMVGLGVARDGRISAARIPLQAQAVAVALMLVGMVRARGDIGWARWESWLFLVSLLLVLALALWAGVGLRGADPTPKAQEVGR